MKKLLLIVALILFAGGLYVNFSMEPSTEQADIMNNTETSDELVENETDEQAETTEEASGISEASADTESEPEPEAAFNQESLDDIYNQAVENNEMLIIDVLLPEYYTEDFMDNLASEFDTETIEFNRLELNANTTNLSEVDVNENSDAVIIDALQIQDYNDEVLPERDLEALTTAYLNVYDNDKSVFLLGNANVHENDNLAATLAEDETFFTDNDYYYIGNQDAETEDEYYDYDNNVMTTGVESEVIANIHDYLISE